MRAVVQADAEDLRRTRNARAKVFGDQWTVGGGWQACGNGMQVGMARECHHGVGRQIPVGMAFEVEDTAVVDQHGSSVFIGQIETHRAVLFSASASGTGWPDSQASSMRLTTSGASCCTQWDTFGR